MNNSEDNLKFEPSRFEELICLGPICSWSKVTNDEADLFAAQVALRLHEKFGAFFIFSPGSDVLVTYDQIGEEAWDEVEIVEPYAVVNVYVRDEPDFAHPEFQRQEAILFVDDVLDPEEITVGHLLQLFADEFISRPPHATNGI